jgi:serine-type D-Ala-D-Ala carboxypeptidase/endopeptidase (penicillin-binding protein 4)
MMTWQSPPLAEVIRDINKFSNNVMARQLFLTLSAEAGPPGTTDKSAARVRKWLQEGGIGANELALENGAGLSRNERISADSLARILLRGFAGQWMPEYVSSLPIAGVDGTTRRRLGDSPAVGRAHIKTGYLEGVRAIAGYVLDKQDRWLVVVSFINHAGAGGAQHFQDAVIEWAYQSGAAGCCARCRGADTSGKCARQAGTAGMR